jgi:hypothetical protein
MFPHSGRALSIVVISAVSSLPLSFFVAQIFHFLQIENLKTNCFTCHTKKNYHFGDSLRLCHSFLQNHHLIFFRFVQRQLLPDQLLYPLIQLHIILKSI